MILMAVIVVTVIALLRQIPAFGAPQGGDGQGPDASGGPSGEQSREQSGEREAPVPSATG